MSRQTAKALSAVFGAAFLIGLVVQALGLGLYLGLHDWAYSVHSRLFSLSPEQFDVACYAVLGLMKALGLMLLFTPWLALRIVAGRLPE